MSRAVDAYVTRWAPVVGRVATARKERDRAGWEAIEDAEPAPEPPRLLPGDVVRYTVAMTLAVYGPHTGGSCASLGRKNAPFERTFTVAACPCGLCALGRHVAVREGDGRHIARAALEHVPRGPAGPVRKQDAAAVLEQLGMRVDEDGTWWLTPPKGGTNARPPEKLRTSKRDGRDHRHRSRRQTSEPKGAARPRKGAKGRKQASRGGKR